MPRLIVDINDDAVLGARGARNAVDVSSANACFVEQEFSRNGILEDCTTILTTNKECPFRCTMCDLWKNTTTERVNAGTITKQIGDALETVPFTPHVKIYNAGNFFDRQSIPKQDTFDITDMLHDRETLVVESHPRLVGTPCFEFAEYLQPQLEVAMGLETVDPVVLPKLNKRMTLDDFERATTSMLEHGIFVRAFILLRTPWQTEEEGVHWAQASIDFAFSIGVECCVVIPTRSGNGMLEQLSLQGEFDQPSLGSLIEVIDYGLLRKRGRVFADLWDITGMNPEIESLTTMNKTQEPLHAP